MSRLPLYRAELVLRAHLPVSAPDDTGRVVCLCDVTQTFAGPIEQRLHVARELLRSGLLVDDERPARATPFRAVERRPFCWRHLAWLCERHG